MWQKYLVITILFYLFTIFQNSFFAHFKFLGSVPNLVFILFFLLIFFDKNINYEVVLFAGIAGILLDISSFAYLGPSIVLLLITGFLFKKTQLLLKNMEDSFPLIYFLPLFLFHFILYNILMMIYLRFWDTSHTLISFDLKFIAGIAYNLFFALLGFWIFKKIKDYVR